MLGVGMALPGTIDPASGAVRSSSILPGWIGVPAAEEMTRLLGMTVQVDNDTNLGALAERAWVPGRDCATLAFIKVASGIGGGLIIDGRVTTARRAGINLARARATVFMIASGMAVLGGIIHRVAPELGDAAAGGRQPAAERHRRRGDRRD